MNAAPDAAPWLAQTLTRRMGRDLRPPLGGPAPGQAKARWAATGLADLTGPPASPPIAPERDFAARLEALLRVTRAMAAMLGQPPRIEMSLYCERAADLGLTRRGSISAGGGARMVRCGDGWIAANLARPEDLDLFDAWIGAPAGADPWGVLAASAARFKAAEMIAAGRLRAARRPPRPEAGRAPRPPLGGKRPCASRSRGPVGCRSVRPLGGAVVRSFVR